MNPAPGQSQQQQQPSALPTFYRGIIKQALSGDSLIIRGQPKGGPPPERQLNLSNINAPRLARRNKNEETKDEPWAWEAREFLRKRLVGRDIFFTIDYRVPGSGREYGCVYIGTTGEMAENVSESILAAGLVSVRRESKADIANLVNIEEQAKSARIGRWGDENEQHIRDIIWQIENPRAFVDKMGRKPIQGVVEHVRDGSTIRLFLLPNFQYVTLMISGIRAPPCAIDQDGRPDPSANPPFAEEARYFTESRLLHRDVDIILETVNNQNFVGSVIHPNGDIAELLLKEGFAKCMDWSMGVVSGGAEKLRAAEKFAKDKKLRIWRDYQASTLSSISALKIQDKEFSGNVMEIINADALNVKCLDGTIRKVFLSSIRPPRLEKVTGDGDKPAPARPKRPLYEIPYMYEAREFLRKKLIGKKVQVIVDYIQPASSSAEQNFPEKMCCTIKIDGINVGEALLAKGLGTVLRHRQDDDQRASDYDNLLAAEAKAQKSGKGLYGKKQELSMSHVVDLTGDAAKAKQYLPYIQRAGKTAAIVEFVASGSRVRLFVPREMRLITLLLAGISCPRLGRADQKTGVVTPGEPFAEEALAFTKELCLQREVEIEVESSDKAGNFVGWLYVDNNNLSVSLVEEGLAKVHFSAERSPHYRALQIAEENAKKRLEKVWLNYEEPKDDVKAAEDDKTERKVDPKHVVVTEVTPDLHIYVQFTNNGDELEALMKEIRRELSEHPPMTGAYTPQKGAVCVAKYSADGEWYRALVEKDLPNREVSVLFIDYGNREKVPASKCAPLPSVPGSTRPGFAKEFLLALITLPADEEYANDAYNYLKQDLLDGKFELNVEYKNGHIDCVTLVNEDKEDVGQSLVRDGYLLVENRKERRLQKLMKEYKAAEKEAQTTHSGVWRYGDITEDDAKEFGMAKPR